MKSTTKEEKQKIPQMEPGPEAIIPIDEDAVKEYLISAGILRVPSDCPACGSTGIRQIRRNQYRCRDCRHEWGVRKGSILEGLRISFRTFITVVRLFADDVPANEAAHRLGLAYNTVSEIYQRIIEHGVSQDQEQLFVFRMVLKVNGLTAEILGRKCAPVLDYRENNAVSSQGPPQFYELFHFPEVLLLDDHAENETHPLFAFW